MEANPSLPLRGLRVIEFCWVWSGPMMGQHLADLGAEVVKVEWYKRFDLYRTRGVERLRGQIPEAERRELSYSFQSLNRNKLDIAADLKTETGLAVVKDLIGQSDILLENFTVGTLDRLGLDAAELDRLNEQLVVISLSATGRGSAIEQLRSYGLMLSALGGYESEVVDGDGQFMGSPTFVMSDPNAAMYGVFAALAGTLHARQTGSGATYECSQVEAVASLMGAPDPAIEPPVLEGTYQCADGPYVAVTIQEPSETLPSDPADFAAWMAQTTVEAAIEAVRKRGGIATPVVSLDESGSCEAFDGLEVRQTVEHPVSGTRDIVATPWLINGTWPPIQRPAPLLGADTDDVMQRVLGYDDEKLEQIRITGELDEPK